MRGLLWITGLAVLWAGQATIVEAEGPSCPHTEIVKARGLAEQRMKAREYTAAVEILRPLRDKCAIFSYRDGSGERQPDLDFYWIHSDLSFALYRAGLFRECLSVLAPLTYPGPPDGLSSNGLDEHPVAKAISYNEGLCEAALTKPYDKLADKPCPHVARLSAEDRSSIALPEQLAQGGRFRCLQIDGGAGHDERRQALASEKELDAKKLCPQLVATGMAGKGRVTLAVSEGTLRAPSDCCLIDSLSAGVVDGKPVVRLRGQGRDCFGGRAYFIADEIYEWRGTKLVLLSSASRIAH